MLSRGIGSKADKKNAIF
uniref:Uncharacterized protein n=1 Tax=Lepeophtheirus salmonis TaxID=72036 RepID=A0A0K2TKZ3_LEPSM